MKIKYKVVKRKTRMSAMINGNSKYALKYLDGKIVMADSFTVGVLVFETLRAADEWCGIWNEENYNRPGKDLIILKVKPVGRGRRVNFLADGVETDALDYWYERKLYTVYSAEAPDRTMAYPGVEVIGEYKWNDAK